MSEDRISVSLQGVDATSLKGLRQTDEDYIIASELGDNVEVSIILDGMGGGAVGDKASENGGKAFLESLKLSNLESKESRKTTLGYCVKAANMAVEKISKEHQSRSGSTLTSVILKRGDGGIEWAELVHIGDTRVYRIRGDETTLLTNDHSMTGEMVRSGYIELHQIEETHGKNVLTMSLGGPDDLNAQIDTIDLQSGDVLLLCCDGVWGPLHTESGMWLGTMSSEEITKEALDRGSTDNCSALFWTI